MDFDAASNLSQISNQSDDIKSSLSSISGLSNYHHEYSQLRHVISPECYTERLEERTQTSTPINDSGCDLQYEDRISDLSHQLQSTLKENEHYKNELFNMELKFEVKYHEKIDNLLRINNKLSIDLANANEQIQRLITNYANKNGPQIESVNFIKLEKKYQELSLEKSNLEGKYIEICKIKNELEHSYQRICTDLNDSQLEIQTKNLCIKELKEKITQQFVEIQMVINNKTEFVQTLNERNLELQQTKSMLEWYKKQLDTTHLSKKKMAEDNNKYKSEIWKKDGRIESLTLEIKSLENKYELCQLEMLKEKEKLYQELEKFQNYVQSNNQPKIDSKADQSMLNYQAHIIEDLRFEIESIRKYVTEQDSTIRRINKENSDLISKCVATQKMLQNKNLELEEFDLIKSQLLSELKILQNKYLEKINETDILKNEKTKLESEIYSCKEEKYFVDTSIKTIREQFSAYSLQYCKLKEELLEKNKQILILQNEKQELFMNNNWRICELEQSKIKEHELNNLKKELCAKENKISEYVAKLQTTECDLMCKNDAMNESELNYQKEIGRYDAVLMEYKDMVVGYQTKVRKLEETISGTKCLLTDLKENLDILKNELHKRNLEILDLKTHNASLLHQIEQWNNEKYVFPKYKDVTPKNEDLTEFKHNELSINVIDPQSQTNISKFDQIIQTEEHIHQVKHLCVHLKASGIKTKYQKLATRVKKLSENVLECKKKLNMLELEKMILEKDKTELNVLLKLKDLNLKENQKKYESNYRTLLKNVKEHMKGRNTAEKHNIHLQGLYNNLYDEKNSLKLLLSSKVDENNENEKRLSDFINMNEKLKEELSELKKKARSTEICIKCVELDAVTKRLCYLEEYVNDVKSERETLEKLVLEKENILLKLQQKVQELESQILSLTRDKNNFSTKIEELQLIQSNYLAEKETYLKLLKDGELKVEYLSNNLEEEKQLMQNKNQEIFTLKAQLSELEDKLHYITKDKETLDISFQACTEELIVLKNQNEKSDSIRFQQCEEHYKIIDELKIRLQETHNALSTVNSDKFFIQRLCNDLKIALKSYVNQNEMLKDKLKNLSINQNDSASSRSTLPDSPSFQSFDQNFINSLLQETRLTRPALDIQLSLETLKKEIYNLQQQISKKNFRVA